MYFYIVPTDKDAMHHGILGMKWGVRRYQNKDGSLTARGKRRLGIGNSNGVTKKSRYATKNTNKSGVSNRNIFTEKNNLKIVNGMYKNHFNCSLCTLAFDMRNRGIDVRAGGTPNTVAGQTTKQIASWYKGDRKVTKNESFWNEYDKQGKAKNPLGIENRLKTSDDQFKKTIIDQGEGTSGHIIFSYCFPDIAIGHDAFYRVENGDVMVYDAQIGSKRPLDDMLFEFNACHVQSFLRTDDLEIKDNIQNIKVIGNTGGDFVRDKNKYFGSPVLDANTPKYNYSPPTISERVEIKPMDYNPPYQSKSEFDLLIEDASQVYKKLKNKLGGVKMDIKKGINKLNKAISDFSSALFWKIF